MIPHPVPPLPCGAQGLFYGRAWPLMIEFSKPWIVRQAMPVSLSCLVAPVHGQFAEAERAIAR
jgi:hypothetical protein